MAKQSDTQIHVTTPNQQIHSPVGLTPAHGADAPIVSPKVVPFSAGKPLVTLQIVLPQGLRISNPA